MNDQHMEIMRVALRVLTQIAEHREPSQSDIDVLRKFAPLLEDGPTDELACDVIQQAMKRRAQVRRLAND